jgi:Putative intracellular protease/amidase
MTPLEGSLKGKKVGVLVESQFIPDEIQTYMSRFGEMGATVEFISRLWDHPCLPFVSDVAEAENDPEILHVTIDLKDRKVTDYAAVIMAANYTSVRLRQFELPPPNEPVTMEHVRSAPAVQFFAEAMRHSEIVKGALCHGLWILTPCPELLKGRSVICHEVVLADVLNAGANFVPADESNRGIVVDGDLVTGRTKKECALFVDAIAQEIIRRSEDSEVDVRQSSEVPRAVMPVVSIEGGARKDER